MNRRSHPIAGTDYPETYPDFLEWFSEEGQCRAFLYNCRWPEGFACSRCLEAAEPWLTSRGYLHCKTCGKEVSLTAETLFEGTRKPLKTWFLAMWFVTSQKDGASALGLQQILGLKSYQTSWTWLHKLRSAMVRPERDLLRGRIEVDETYVGGLNTGGKRGRGSEAKQIVLIAVELRSPRGFGRIRMQQVDDVSGKSLVGFVRDVTEKGSTIQTDGWTGYNGLTKAGYTHEKTVISSSGDPAHVSMPGVHRVASLMKRWLMSTHQGSISQKHLGYYLDEYTFRFNRRSSKSRGLLFYRLVEQAAHPPPLSYRQLVDQNDNI